MQENVLSVLVLWINPFIILKHKSDYLSSLLCALPWRAEAEINPKGFLLSSPSCWPPSLCIYARPLPTRTAPASTWNHASQHWLSIPIPSYFPCMHPQLSVLFVAYRGEQRSFFFLDQYWFFSTQDCASHTGPQIVLNKWDDCCIIDWHGCLFLEVVFEAFHISAMEQWPFFSWALNYPGLTWTQTHWLNKENIILGTRLVKEEPGWLANHSKAYTRIKRAKKADPWGANMNGSLRVGVWSGKSSLRR